MTKDEHAEYLNECWQEDIRLMTEEHDSNLPEQDLSGMDVVSGGKHGTPGIKAASDEKPANPNTEIKGQSSRRGTWRTKTSTYALICTFRNGLIMRRHEQYTN